MILALSTSLCYAGFAFLMNKKWLLILGLVLILLSAGGFFLRGLLVPAQAKLHIAETNVPAAVVVDGEQVSSVTPYEGYRKPGEVVLRLVPQVGDSPLAPWETKLSLVDGVTTVIKRDFGPTIAASSGELLSFEKIGGRTAELVVVSAPDSVQVKLDGEPRGFTPLPITNISAGEHTISASRPEYKEREIKSVKTVPGYRLTVVVFLAEDQTAQTKPQEEVVKQTVVEIQQTGTGFLRVRSQPSLAAAEVARVVPAKQYLFLEQSQDGGWFKIEYEKGESGWISAQYAKKVEVHPEPNGSGATESAKPKE